MTTSQQMSQVYYIYQTQEDGDSELLYTTYDKEAAEDEVDRINSLLSSAGIPSWVSCAYYE